MDQDRLAALISQPEVQRMILNDYQGSYSIGLTLNPDNRRELAIRVRIEGDDTSGIPSQIVLEGETIPVIVTPDFKKPEPLARAESS